MDDTRAASTDHAGIKTRALLVAVFTIATCGLIYELLAGTIASYLLGDSVTQFSTIIGVYLSAMGVGSYLSRHFRRDLVTRFIEIEILVGVIGGISSPVLFFAFGQIDAFRVVLYGWVTATGVLVGLEIPFLIRILENQFPLRDLVSKVLSLDYLGALAASLLFPLWLVPRVGLMRSSFVFGVLNVLVAVWTCHLFHAQHRRPWLTAQAYGALVLLLLGVAFSDDLMELSERQLYEDAVILSRSSPYQRIVLTQKDGEVRLFLNGDLQFSSLDEYRYHEALVHPGLAAVATPRRVLVLGGGDGMAVREILRDDRVEQVTLVDLDPMMTEIFVEHDGFAALNDYALRSPRVELVNADAFIWLEEDAGRYDFIVVDFPDPSNYSLGKLYTTTFYLRLAAHLEAGGVVAIQSTSPLVSRQAFWCIVETVRAAGLHAAPYHASVPTFGEWGFVVASREPFQVPTRFPDTLRFLTPAIAGSLFEFPADMARVPVEVNHLNNQILVHYHTDGWNQYARAPSLDAR
jgi:spermidine synthase|tara:strand:+ start:784 stop:2340 length:1557 start_codon:yes stop_codon:yes gene_type:complete